MTKHFKKSLVHGIRVAILIGIACLMRAEHIAFLNSSTSVDLNPSAAKPLFPLAHSLEYDSATDQTNVLNETRELLGYVLQTSPQCDHILGFSGPTNVLIGFDTDDQVVGLHILTSGDTRDHVKQITDDTNFMSSLDGISRADAAELSFDAVSGATLTSLAIRESVALRLGKKSVGSLRFPNEPELKTIQILFPDATSTSLNEANSKCQVLDQNGNELGSILRTSPSADTTIGYQGPTDTLIGINNDGQIIGFAIGESFDNEPYVSYVREDDYFRKSFNDLSVEQLAHLDLMEAQVEGVSGATMTSMAAADGMILAAQNRINELAAQKNKPTTPVWYSFLSAHDIGTMVVVLAGAAIGLSRWRGNKNIGLIWKLVLVAYLGLTAGNLVSQAMFVGWAKNGIPIRNALGLLVLSVAALSLPIFTRRNIYCTHLCPHGALQQLANRRLKWQPKIPAQLKTLMSFVPAFLLLWCVIVGMSSLAFSLVDIEPFDAYVFRIAGPATIVVAIVGLFASLFVPMAYCRYGCPTGALLQFLRFNAKANHWTLRDWVALGFFLIAVAMRLL